MHPYVIEQCGDKWCLYDSTKSRVLGTHAAREDAVAQEQAIKASQHYALTAREIFAVGTHNGDSYSEDDLDAMVVASRELDFLPAVKLGHTNAPGAPAYGYVENLRRVGGKLLADITHLPQEIYDQVQSRKFGRVSAEVYWNLKRGGKTYHRALGAVALLGAEIPGVVGLRPLYAYTADVGTMCRVHEMMQQEEEDMSEDVKILQAKLAALEAKTAVTETEAQTYKSQAEESRRKIASLEAAQRATMVESRMNAVTVPAMRPYIKALYEQVMGSETKLKLYVAGKAEEHTAEAVLDKLVAYINEKAMALFGAQSLHSERPASYTDASAEVDRRAREHMATGKHADYAAAVHAVLSQDGELSQQYTQS